ncbi:2'-5' RNA ligase family protein [Lewinella sp. JB7]|uniref:2'-5' RNA ligase family protein n=1 Tax=Lewinella sp. JB7 TaxID=2962887 RepID=UPI0020C9C3CA|nr:2'-5' RNA ligase family protein [Lewinella sp. JB7]MCP9237744.1 2'-5' RNA ligase family protein [Lewinella sp. JB7]
MPHPLPPPPQRAMIVTLLVHPEDLAPFDALRRRFFPAQRNHLSAHVTLFHHIPPEQRDSFIQFAERRFTDQPPFSVEVGQPISLGGGVAYPLDLPPLAALRAPLRERFAEVLTPQDRRPWRRPHITVQNKVDKATADRLLRHLRRRFRPRRIRITGLEFHRYDGGPWTGLHQIRFAPLP